MTLTPPTSKYQPIIQKCSLTSSQSQLGAPKSNMRLRGLAPGLLAGGAWLKLEGGLEAGGTSGAKEASLCRSRSVEWGAGDEDYPGGGRRVSARYKPQRGALQRKLLSRSAPSFPAISEPRPGARGHSVAVLGHWGGKAWRNSHRWRSRRSCGAGAARTRWDAGEG